MEKHTCPFGLKSLYLLQKKGFEVSDHWLETRGQVDAFKEEHQVKTTPQTFIEGQRIGGYDDLRRYFGKTVADPKAVTYRPVIAIFATTALMAFALSMSVMGALVIGMALEWFIAISMCVLAITKLQDIERFSSMFLNYDLLAKKWLPYAYIYPFAEALAGILMLSGRLRWLAAPLSLLIGSIGAISVLKAVYLDKRELKCACVGGGSNVPLGFVSLLENLMMVLMGVITLMS